MTEPRTVSAKIKVQFRQDVSDDQVRVDFAPDYEDGRNREWAKYTPALSLSMTVKSEVADKHFPMGQSFGLVFIPEPKEGGQ